MADMKGLAGFVLAVVLIGMILGVAMLVFENFGNSAFQLKTATNSSITPPEANINVSLAKGNLTAFTALRSSTGATCSVGNYTVFNEPGVLQLLDNVTCCTSVSGVCYVDYSYYEYNTATKGAMVNMINATSPIGTTWLSLIVTVMVLAIIIGLVIASFSQPR